MDVATGPVVTRPRPTAPAIADLAVRALRAEADLTPKPGLVDRRAKGELGTGIWAVKVRPQDFRHSFDASACGDGPTPDFEIERL